MYRYILVLVRITSTKIILIIYCGVFNTEVSYRWKKFMWKSMFMIPFVLAAKEKIIIIE